jgi:rhamnosyltransferase subunit B
MLDAADDLLIGRELNRVRDSLGLPPVRRIFRWWLSPELVIGMFPQWYAAPQTDWPPQLRRAGLPRFDGGASATLPADLVDFCRVLAPPSAFTLGTGMRHGAEFFHTAVAACGMLGRRGILLTRHAHQLPTPLPRAVRHVAFAPFQSSCPCALPWCTMAGSARRHGHWPQARRSWCCLWRGTSRANDLRFPRL